MSVSEVHLESWHIQWTRRPIAPALFQGKIDFTGFQNHSFIGGLSLNSPEKVISFIHYYFALLTLLFGTCEREDSGGQDFGMSQRAVLPLPCT